MVLQAFTKATYTDFHMAWSGETVLNLILANFY